MDLSSPSLLTLFRNNCLTWPSKASSSSDFFLSFEDALWSYLHDFPPDGKVALLPNFFCSDVTNRLIERGFEIHFYEFDSNLSLMKESFIDLCKTMTPSLCMVYYPMGVRQPTPSINWFRELCGESCLIIEDLADSLVEENQVNLIDRNHIAIDSLRKVLPVQGSRIWSKQKICTKSTFSLYRYKAFLFWQVYRFLCSLFAITKNNFLDTVRWYVFGLHSDLIGSQKLGARGFLLDKWVLGFIDFKKIKIKKAFFSKIYSEVLNPKNQNNATLIPIPENDHTEVRFRIIRGNKNTLSNKAQKLETIGVICDLHFEDSLLGELHDFLLLPVGLSDNKSKFQHEQKINNISRVISE